MSDKCNDPGCTFPACNCWEGKFSDAVTDYDTKLGPYIHVNEHNRHQKVLKDRIAELESNEAFSRRIEELAAEVKRLKRDWNMESKGLNSKIAELEQELVDVYDRLNWRTLQRDNEIKENKRLKKQANCPYSHISLQQCANCGWNGLSGTSLYEQSLEGTDNGN